MTSSIELPETQLSNSEPRLRSLWTIFKEDWRLVLFCAFLSLILASVLTEGWPGGLWPDLSVPLGYSGDGLFHAWMAQRVSEGWLYENARSGFPFGSNFLDYPGSDFGSHFLIKVFSQLSSSSFAGVNIFFLMGFPVCFSTAFVVARAFGLFRSLAVVGALLFTFLPFHFLRLGHLFYTWYFVVPLFFYLSFSLFRYSDNTGVKAKKHFFPVRSILAVFGLLMLSSFGVYYALFGVIVVLLGGALGWIKSGQFEVAGRSLLIVVVLVAGVLVNVAPTFIGRLEFGANLEVAQRSPMESEVYGFKLMQLVLPRANHRIPQLSKYTDFYKSTFPLVNENSTSSLGVVGAVGLLLGFCLMFWTLAGRKVDPRLGFLVALVFLLFMFGTVGGLGSVFSIFISSSIRAWNRISVFVGFGTILIFFVMLQLLIERGRPKLRIYVPAIAIFILVIGLYDQTVPACAPCSANQKVLYESDKKFVESIEASLPSGAAVYQLPYLAFPETPPLNNLNSYQLATGVLHSKSLHWSFGGMKGRPGDLFYRSLSHESVEKQLEVIRNLGFNGIYIDRRGYADNAQGIVKAFTDLLGAGPSLSSANGSLVFFSLNSPVSSDLVGLSASKLFEKSGYFADALGKRYTATLEQGIDFSRAEWPGFVRDAKGFSANEQWGRWSDRNLSKTVRIDFTTPLPNKFTLILVANGFTSNANKPTKVLIGSEEYEIALASNTSEVRLPVDLHGDSATNISFIPPDPVSPHQLGMSVDMRRLGVGFVSLRFER